MGDFHDHSAARVSVKPRWLQNKAVRGFLHVLGGTASFTALQGLQFLVLARGLGPTEFGRLAAAGSITALLVPFSGMGAANVMVMRATRDSSLLPLYFGNALSVMVGTGALLVLVAGVIAQLFLPEQVSLGLMVLWAISELITVKVIDICWHVFIAREELHYTSRIMSMQSASRLLFALLFVWVSPNSTAASWAWWALLSNFLISGWVLSRTMRIVGRPRASLKVIRKEFATGGSFAIGISAKNFYTDADKLFLARYAGAEAVGHYTVAFRVIQIALAPIRALSFALQARLFRAGEGGIHKTLRVTAKILAPLSAAALVLALGFYITAPLLTIFAGERYAGSVDVLRTLSLMPLLLAVQALLADTLATSGYQRLAALSQVGAAVLICVLCVVLIPTHGWRGAAIASYAAQFALSLAMAFTIYRCSRVALQRASDAST